MTKAKAMTVASAIINAEYSPRIVKLGPDDFIIFIESDTPIDVQLLASFATAQSVTGMFFKAQLS